MANLVEFIVKVKDLASGTIGKLATNMDSSLGKMEAGLSRFYNRTNSLKMSLSDIDKRMSELQKTRSISLDDRQIRRINQELNDLQRKKDRLENNGSSLMGGMRGLAAGILATAGIAGIGGIINSGMERQLTNKRLEVMTDKNTGQQMSSNLTDFAQKTIYGNEVFGVAQTMLSFGVAAENVMPAVSRLGDIASGDANRLQSLGLAFSQVASTGRLMGQDLLQLVNAGFNPLDEIHKKTGRSMADLKKDMEAGKISYAMVAQAIESATNKGGRFFEMTKQLAETAPGKLLALQGSFEGLMGTIGSGLLNALEPLIDIFQYLVDYPELILGIVAAFGAYMIVVKGAAVAQGILNFVMSLNPIGLLVMAIVGLIILIVHLVKKYDGWGKAMMNLWGSIKSFVSYVGLAFKDFFQEVGYRLEMFVLKMMHSFQFIGGVIQNFIKALSLASQGKFLDAKNALFAEIKTSASAEIEALEKNRKDQKKKNLNEMAGSIKSMQVLWGGVKLTKAIGEKSADSIGGMNTSFSGMTSAPSAGVDANKGITSGVKNLTINIGKFQDKTEIHTTTLNEGFENFEDKLMEMFLRVANSGGAAIAD